MLYDLSADKACPSITIDSIIPPEIMGKQHYEKYHWNKSDLVDELAVISPSSLCSEQPRFDAFVLDGPAATYMIKPKNGSMIDEYCKTFLSYL